MIKRKLPEENSLFNCHQETSIEEGILCGTRTQYMEFLTPLHLPKGLLRFAISGGKHCVGLGIQSTVPVVAWLTQRC